MSFQGQRNYNTLNSVQMKTTIIYVKPNYGFEKSKLIKLDGLLKRTGMAWSDQDHDPYCIVSQAEKYKVLVQETIVDNMKGRTGRAASAGLRSSRG